MAEQAEWMKRKHGAALIAKQVDEIERLRAEAIRLRSYNEGLAKIAAQQDEQIERLRARNAALVEIVRDSPCPADRSVIVANCQQCGCSHGLMIRPLEQNGDKQ